MMNYDEYHKLNLFSTSIVTLRFQKKPQMFMTYRPLNF